MNLGGPLFSKASPNQFHATGLQPTLIKNNSIYLNSYEECHNNPIPGTSQETQPQEPSMVFTVQPPDKYRFRYLSENGSHGQLKTNSVFPMIELKNFHKPGPVEIKVEIYTWDPDPKKRQPHRILQFKQRKGLKSSISYICYKRNGCFPIELKGVRIMKLTKSDLQKEHKMTYEAAEAAWSQDRDLPGCLRVEASYQNNVIGTIYSNTITTLLPSSLRIHNVFPKHLRAREDLCILTDLVKKNDIEVFLINEDTHDEQMCPIETYHHQYTIVCKIPEIRNQDNTNPVQLKLYLHRPSDNTMSNFYEVTYTNDYYLPQKRKRASLQGEDWDVCRDLTPLQPQQQRPLQQQQQQHHDPQLQQQQQYWHWHQSVCQQQHHLHESSQSQLQHEQQLMPIIQQVSNDLVPHQQNPAVPQQSQNQQVSPIPNHVQVPGNQESPSNHSSFSDESGQSQSSFSNSAPACHLVPTTNNQPLHMGPTQLGEVQSHTGHGQFLEDLGQNLGNKMDCTTNDKYDNNFSGQQNPPIRSLDNTYMSNSDSNAGYVYGPLGNYNCQYDTYNKDEYEYDSCSNKDDLRPNNTRRSQGGHLPKDFRDEEENKANQGIQNSNTLDVDETTQIEEDDKQKPYGSVEMDQLIKRIEHINIKRETEVPDTATNTSYYTGSIPGGSFNENDSQYAGHAERTDRSAEKTDQSESIEGEGKQNRPLLTGVNITKKEPKQRNDSNSYTTGNPEQDKDKSYDNGGEKNFERLLANAEPDSKMISTGKSLDTGSYEKHPPGADTKERNFYSTEGNIKMNNHSARRVRNGTKDATRKEASTGQDYNNPGDKTENDEQSSRISETEVQQGPKSQNKSENSEQNNSEPIYKVQMTTQVKNKSARQGEETTEDGEGGKEEEVQEELGDEKEKKAEEKQEVEKEEEGEDDEEEEGEDEGEEEEAEGDNDVEEEEEEEGEDEGEKEEEEVQEELGDEKEKMAEEKQEVEEEEEGEDEWEEEEAEGDNDEEEEEEEGEDEGGEEEEEEEEGEDEGEEEEEEEEGEDEGEEEEEEGEDDKEDDVLIDKETPNETLICLGAAATKVRKLVKGNGTNEQSRGEAPGKRTVSVERDDSSYQGRETLKEMIFPTIKRHRQLMRRETELIQREREILEREIQLVKRERELEERTKQLTEVREKSQKKINLGEGKHGTHQSLKSRGTQFSNTQKKSTTIKANTNDIKGKGDLTIKDENSKLWHATTSLDGKGKEEDVVTKEKSNISKRQCSLNIGKGNERETANGNGEMDTRTLLQEMTGITEETDMLNLNISIKQKAKLEKISEERTQKREENDRRFVNENITKKKDNDGENEEIPTSGCIQRAPEERKEINENKIGIEIKEDEFLDDKDVFQNADLGEGEIIKRHNREMDIEQQLCSEKENVKVAETDEAKETIKDRVRVQEMDRILDRDLNITVEKDTNLESGEVNNENEDTYKGKKIKDGKSLVESEKETVLYITEIIEEHHIGRKDEATGIMETLKLTIKNEATDEEKREEPAYGREVNVVVGQENVTTEQVKQTTDVQEEEVLIRQEEKTTVRQEIFITGQKRESYPKQGEINTEQEKETITGQDENVIKGQDEEATTKYEGITIAEKKELPTVWQEEAVDRLGGDATTGQKKDAINEQEDGTVYKHEGNVTDTQEEEIAKQEVETANEDREEACAGHEEAVTAGLENITIIGSEKRTSSEQEGTVAEREEATLSEKQFTNFLTEGDAITVQKEELFNGLAETTTPLKREANAGQEEKTIMEMQGVTARKEGYKTTEHGVEPTDGLEETTAWKKDEAEATADQEEKYTRQGPLATTTQEDSSDWQKEKTHTEKEEETITGENEKTIAGQMADTGQEEDAIIREESVEIPEQEENAITGVGKETTFGERAAMAGWEAEGIAGQGEDPITLKKEKAITGQGEYRLTCRGAEETAWQEEEITLQKEKAIAGLEDHRFTCRGEETAWQEEDALTLQKEKSVAGQEDQRFTCRGEETGWQEEDAITFQRTKAIAGLGDHRFTCRGEETAWQEEDALTLQKEKSVAGQEDQRFTCQGEETAWQEEDAITFQRTKAIAGLGDHRFTCRGGETAWQEEDAITFQRTKAIAGQGDHRFTCRRKEETAGQKEDAITLQKEKSTAGQGEPRFTCRGEEETASQEEVAITLKKEKAVTGQGEQNKFTWRNEEENAGQEGDTITTREKDAIPAPDEATTGQEQNLFIRQEAEAPAEQKGTPYGQADATNIWEEEASVGKEAVTKQEEYLVIEQEEAKPIWLKGEATTGQVKNESIIPEDEAITKQEKATTGQEDVFIELEKEATTELQKEIIFGREYSTAWHKEKVLTTLNEKNITGQVENATVSQEDKLTIVQKETGGELEEAGKEVTVGQEADTVNEHIKANNQEIFNNCTQRNSLMTGVVSKTETNMKGKLTEKQTKLVEKLAEDFYPDMRQEEMNSTVEPSDTEYETAYEYTNQKKHTKKAKTKQANKRDRKSSCRARNVTDDVCESTSDEGDCKKSIREQSIKEVTNAESNNVNKDGKSKTVSGRTDKDLFNKTYKECNDCSGSKSSSGEKTLCGNCGSSLEEGKSHGNSESSIKIEIDGNNENSPADETSDENIAEDERSDENSPADERSDENSAEDERSDENSPADETSDENSAVDETSDENSSEDETSDENSAEDETSHKNNENSEIIESSTEEVVDGHHESSNEQETDVEEEIVKEKYNVIVDNEGEVEKRRNKRARETRRTNTSGKRTGDDNLQDTSSEADFNASSHRRALTATELGPSGAESGGNTMKQDQNRKSTKPRGSPAQPTTPAEMAPRNPSSRDGRGSGEILCTTEKGKRRTDFEAKETKNSVKNARGNVTRDERDERSRMSRDCHDSSPVKEEDSTRPISNTKGSGQRQKRKNNGDISVKDKSTKRMKGRKKCTQDNKENAKEVPEQEDVNNRWLCRMS